MEEEKCLTQEEIDDLHLAFDLFLEENNKLNVNKLLENFKLINLHTKHKNIFDFFDNIKNKEITFDEFIKQINKKLNENDNTEILLKIFNLFANNNNNENNNNNNETDENNNETNENNKIDAKKFLFEIGNSDFLNLNKFSLFSDEKNDVNDDKDFIPELNVGKACWNCYKQIKNIFPLNFEQKFFCCEKCLNDYVNKNLIVCDYCKKNIIKFRQILFGNKKYCSMECCNADRNKIVEEENEDDNNNNNLGNDKINKAKEIIKKSNENKNIINDEIIDILDI